MVLTCVILCFKQSTAFDMRISDWSSDVCSSDRIVPRLCEERMGSGLCRHSFFPLLAHLRLEIFVHMIRHIAAIADGPDDERSAAHDVSCRKHAVERGHHGAVVDA